MSGPVPCQKVVPCHDFDTWRIRGAEEIIRPGDVLVDCAGMARGPIPGNWAGVGHPVSKYTTSRSGLTAPPARAFLTPP